MKSSLSVSIIYLMVESGVANLPHRVELRWGGELSLEF
jgi:hypothetical protein